MSTSEQPGGIGHLRCSDGDRDLIAEVLAQAFSEGRITFEEHDERLTRVYAAKTFGELDQLTDDLVDPSDSAAATHRSAHAMAERRSTPVPAAGTVLKDSTTILSTLRSGSRLHLSARTHLSVIAGEARVDLVDATFTSDKVTLDINIFMGEVRIRVPEGVRIVNSLTNIAGEYTPRNMPVGPFTVTVELAGTVVLGAVKVLGPGGRPGKYERFAR